MGGRSANDKEQGGTEVFVATLLGNKASGKRRSLLGKSTVKMMEEGAV